jgi:DNA-binding MarR family transcriptional regulator
MARKATAKNIPDDLIKLADGLHSAAIYLLRQVRTEDRSTGIGPAQLSALSVLVFGGAMSLKKLATVEQVKPPTMVRIVQALLEQKLVVRRTDRKDARKLQISATARGQSLMQKARARRVDKLAQMLQQKSNAEQKQIAQTVEILQRLKQHSV